MKKLLKIVLWVLCITLIILWWLSVIAYYKLYNIDDSWCPEWMHLHNSKVSVASCNDCELTKRQYERWEKYVFNDKCSAREKTCYVCGKAPLPDCQCTYQFKLIKVNDFVWYLLKLIYK